jgi:hypothetical protein
MFPSEIRMAPTKTNQTGRVLNPVSNLLPISNSVRNKVRCKVISGSKWKGPTKTGARERKTITGHNRIGNLVEAEADQAEEAGVVAVAVEGKQLQ